MCEHIKSITVTLGHTEHVKNRKLKSVSLRRTATQELLGLTHRGPVCVYFLCSGFRSPLSHFALCYHNVFGYTYFIVLFYRLAGGPLCGPNL